jgi:hypothetical protein
MFNGISAPLSQSEAKDGQRQLGHSTLAWLLAHGDCLSWGLLACRVAALSE